jgi:hypothetical protein
VGVVVSVGVIVSVGEGMPVGVPVGGREGIGDGSGALMVGVAIGNDVPRGGDGIGGWMGAGDGGSVGAGAGGRGGVAVGIGRMDDVGAGVAGSGVSGDPPGPRSRVGETPGGGVAVAVSGLPGSVTPSGAVVGVGNGVTLPRTSCPVGGTVTDGAAPTGSVGVRP